jgi:hypothetical protein
MAKRSNLSIAKQLNDQIYSKLGAAIQESAVEIANGLAQAGPAWSGEFSSAWDVVPAGESGKPPRATGRVYVYDKRNFPAERYKKALLNRKNRFEIVNTAPHAAIALDQEESIFTRQGQPEPVKPIIKEGFRPKSGDGEQEPSLRPDVAMGYTNEKPNAGITAEQDWFNTYADGGQLTRDLRVGAERAFVRRGPDL